MPSSAVRFFTAPAGRGQSPGLREALTALPQLVGLWPADVVDPADPAFSGLLARLRRALRAERQRGVAGHWSYDLARHSELLTVYRILTDAHRREAQTEKRPRTLRCKAD